MSIVDASLIIYVLNGVIGLISLFLFHTIIIIIEIKSATQKVEINNV